VGRVVGEGLVLIDAAARCELAQRSFDDRVGSCDEVGGNSEVESGSGIVEKLPAGLGDPAPRLGR
jgi:hypothetical protein